MSEFEDYRLDNEAPQYWIVERYVEGDNYVTVVDMLGERMVFEYPLEEYAKAAMRPFFAEYDQG